MRISDWSSDVCSSDLKTRKARLVERFDLRLVNAELQFSKNSMSGRAVVDGAVRPSDFLLVGAVTELNYNKIGRASCRERCVSTCRSRWSPYHEKKKKIKHRNRYKQVVETNPRK